MDSQKSLANRVVDRMYDNDAFSIWLGIERIEESSGYSKLKMRIRKEMLNGFGIAHGGISFSFADSALAFAANSYGKQAVSIQCAINHIKPVYENDELIAITTEKSRSKHLAVYEIAITNQFDVMVALFNGLVYIKESDWDV